MSNPTLKERMDAGETLAGTFIKTPAPEIVEILAMSGLDFLALDAEHSPFDRGRMDACLGIARAVGVPCLVRIPDGTQAEILKVMDSGAVGVVVPHVDSVEKARDIARWSRFGHGGRGFAGSTRWAGFATRTMSDILAQSERETVVLAQIEEPEGVEAIDEIAAVDGIDGLFVGPADLAVCYGKTDITDPVVRDALATVGRAAKSAGKTCVTFAPSTAMVPELQGLGVSMFFIGSEQSFMLAGAKQVAEGIG